MKILAFDQASVKTGVAWFEDTTLLGFATIDLSKREKEEHIRIMILEMYKFIEEHKPDVIVFEDVAMQRNSATLILLTRIQGALLGYCFSHGITAVIYKPSVWRKMLHFTQGSKVKRQVLKQQAVAFVKKFYNTDANEDEADAICIGCAFACVQKEMKV